MPFALTKILESKQFQLGLKGEDGCPTGYEAIYDVETCIKASNELGLVYNAKKSDGKSDSVCNWCGGCNPKSTRVTNKHKHLAKWVCQKGYTLFENKFLDILCKKATSADLSENFYIKS